MNQFTTLYPEEPLPPPHTLLRDRKANPHSRSRNKSIKSLDSTQPQSRNLISGDDKPLKGNVLLQLEDVRQSFFDVINRLARDLVSGRMAEVECRRQLMITVARKQRGGGLSRGAEGDHPVKEQIVSLTRQAMKVDLAANYKGSRRADSIGEECRLRQRIIRCSLCRTLNEAYEKREELMTKLEVCTCDCQWLVLCVDDDVWSYSM